MSPEQELAALHRQVRELSEELAEYRRQDDVSLLGDKADVVRRKAIAHRLNMRAPNYYWVHLILALMHAPGLTIAHAVMIDHLASDQDISPKTVNVAACHARAALKPHGLNIETEWGIGYRMAADDCSRLRELLGDLLDD